MNFPHLAMPQGGGAGIRGSNVVTAGGSITVEVGPNDDSVSVTNAGTGERTDHDVSPGKNNTIPIPNVPGGTWLLIRVGKGLRARVIAVEVISTSP